MTSISHHSCLNQNFLPVNKINLSHFPTKMETFLEDTTRTQQQNTMRGHNCLCQGDLRCKSDDPLFHSHHLREFCNKVDLSAAVQLPHCLRIATLAVLRRENQDHRLVTLNWPWPFYMRGCANREPNPREILYLSPKGCQTVLQCQKGLIIPLFWPILVKFLLYTF